MRVLVFKTFEELEAYHLSKEGTYSDSYKYTGLIHDDSTVDIYENGQYYDTFEEVEDYNNIEV